MLIPLGVREQFKGGTRVADRETAEFKKINLYRYIEKKITILIEILFLGGTIFYSGVQF